MSLRDHIARSKVDVYTALLFMRATCRLHPVYCAIRRKNKIYELWGHRYNNRKIISCKQLEQMTLVQFVEWLMERYPTAKILFPDPTVYRKEEG